MDNNRFYSGGNKSGNSDDPGPIPDRWLHCPRTSRAFVANRFLAFKTPLSARFATKIEPQHYFQPDMVFSYMKMEKVMTKKHTQHSIFKQRLYERRQRGRKRE